MVDRYWQGETEVLGEKQYVSGVVVEWMGVEQWWNGTDSGNWSVGRETLCSVRVMWMNGCGAIVEWYWRGTEAMGVKNYVAWVVCEWMGVEQLWNGPDRETKLLGDKHYVALGAVEWMCGEQW